MKSPAVRVRREPVSLPTYQPEPPDKNPMFLEKRVYQGSSGKVYPLPFTDRISEKRKEVEWDAIHLENEYLYLMILPQIGGRIHIGLDKTNGYDFFYRQNVIKPALVGLAGSWISGGVEFNWPQHHRPATFMAVAVEIERHEDGSVTVWLGDHDPMSRMKGMHGVCLHPGRAVLELKVRAYNRTPLTQTFLWWANVATRVHEHYQSFFPPDVRYVADHAKRAMSEFPHCRESYYGVDYGAREAHGVSPNEAPRCFIPTGDYAANDLSWYANIPVPTSYMAMGSKEDFFGGYDHAREAGLVHLANHHISPGKKQWTWGNHEFGYAWDRNLTDEDGPYIELMAGVYTDNQPDFSFLAPGETKTWSQYWYPIQKTGPAQQANLRAALSLRVEGTRIRAGVSVTETCSGAVIRLEAKGKTVAEWPCELAPGKSFNGEAVLPRGAAVTDLQLALFDGSGNEWIHYSPVTPVKVEVPAAATEPLLPEEIECNEELYITGLHLDQYRHATRHPEIYWQEALRRDPFDARCNNAMGLWHLRRGEFSDAELHLRRAIERLTRRNPNPSDGEPFYHLGLTLRHLGRDEEAYASFYKATWNQAWQAAAFPALAELDCKRGEWNTALDHLDRGLQVNTGNLKSRNLKAIVLRRLGLDKEATAVLRETLALDPLDWWARVLCGESPRCDSQTRLDLALDFANAGFYADAAALLETATPEPESGTTPLVGYYLGWLHEQMGEQKAARNYYKDAAKASPDYCFPARLEEIAILNAAMAANPGDARAPYYLGNLFYDKRRHEEAIRLWEKSAKLDPSFSIVWRNLGIGWFNIRHMPAKARTAYEKALWANPGDARLLYERDQLWKRIGELPEKRLRQLEKHVGLVRQRDDLSVEICALYNLVGRSEAALEILSGRKFQPWEGGEGLALGQHVRTHLALGRTVLSKGDAACARAHFEVALASPENLSEARHPLANQSDVWFWLGEACAALGDKTAARQWWTKAATFRGDFQEMSVRAFSEMTYYSARSLERLGKKAQAEKLLAGLLDYAIQLSRSKAKIDYFATSLPAMLLFEDDLQARQETASIFLAAQAHLGVGGKSKAKAKRLLNQVLERDPSHALAADLLMELK